MYWYHTNLRATHPFQSKAYMWPLDIKPVWLWVRSGFGVVQSIYAMGNPLIFWGGVLCAAAICIEAFRMKSIKLLFLLACYFVFWLPWIFSPRLMFLYHYLPSVPFLVICTAYILEKIFYAYKQKGAAVFMCYIAAVFLTFLYMYPCWTGMQVEKERDNTYLWRKVLK
jgi:dolichyl-phosphate-mannose--protein O-mannosyl transferase